MPAGRPISVTAGVTGLTSPAAGAAESAGFTALMREIHDGRNAIGSNSVVVVRAAVLDLLDVVAGAATARLVANKAKTISTLPRRTLL